MLIQICQKIEENLVKSGMISQDLADWFIYWMEKRLITAFTVCLMLMFGSLLFGVEITACFLLGILPLRRRLPGLHANSPYACILISLATMITALLFLVPFNSLAMLVFSGVNFIVCLVLVVGVLKSQTDLRLHMEEEEIAENHKRAVHIVILESAVGLAVAMLLHSARCLSACQMGIAVAVLSAACSKINAKGSGYTMAKFIVAVKRVIGQHIEKCVQKEKSEMPATCTPVFFQPERPRKEAKSKEKIT